MEIKPIIEDTLSRLKDFQQNTVNSALENFSKGQNRFLVADEVGLGKTIVAKGIVANLYLEAYQKGNDFQVIYICSNKALAKQNLGKLVPFTGKIGDIDTRQVIDFSDEDDRLTSLAYQDKEMENNLRFRIKALTPGTSFDTKSKAGKKDERILIYRILSKTEYFKNRKTALKWFLRATVNHDNWERDLNSQSRPIRADVDAKFIECLQGKIVDADLFREIERCYLPLLKGIDKIPSSSFIDVLQCIIPENKRGRNTKDYIPSTTIVNKIIGEMRLRLASACKDYLKADLFILDEFQRFKQIIDSDQQAENPGVQLAKQIFDKKDAKLLLLSATPYKAYSTQYEQLHGEDHYQEFKSVLRFLLPYFTASDWAALDKWNQDYFDGLKSIERVSLSDPKLLDAKNEIEKVYKKAISRTERNLVETYSENMENVLKYLDVNESDLNDFIVIDGIIKKINSININSNKKDQAKLPIPIEYVKSAPFSMSFLADYEHFRVLQKYYTEHREIKKTVKQAKNAFIDKEKIGDYKPLIPERATIPNPKLRLLYDDVRSNGWNLLWIPATLPYYKVNNLPYTGCSADEKKEFSKTLIFSAWKMVPRMISTLVSYEAERLSIGEFLKKNPRQSEELKKKSKNDTKRYPYPLLVYRKDETANSMMNFALTYPCLSLAKLIDPVLNINEQLSYNELLKQSKQRIIEKLLALNIQNIGVEQGNKNNWKWYALLFLDKHLNYKEADEWFRQSDKIGDDSDTIDDEERGTKNVILKQFKKHFENNEIEESLAKLKEDDLDDLSEYLAKMSLGSPAICSYRALERIFESDDERMNVSHFISNGFRTLFNKPESISIIRQYFDRSGYYNNVLDYCINGNIQAVLDEFFYQLNDSGGLYNSNDLAIFVDNILSVSASSLDVKTVDSLAGKKDLKMRVHYAMPFGMEGKADEKRANRIIKVREAFNSPFRPFVLTSTSIGQEGLDFHYYCDKLIHWNLPHNPIDLEQREGRIKRYKGFNIRKKMIKNLDLNEISVNSSSSIWKTIYQSVEEKNLGKCDLIPFWHYPDKENPNSIETIIPLYPYSKDFEKLKYIKNVLGNYRMTFGQPRQEELSYLLGENVKNKEYKENLMKFLINLCPTKL